MVAILAPLALDGFLTSSYLLLEGSYGEPTGTRAAVTTVSWLFSSSLAYLAAGYVAGRISGSSGGSNGAVSVVLGMLVPLALPTGPFFLLLEGYFLEGLAAVGIALAGGYLGEGSASVSATEGRNPTVRKAHTARPEPAPQCPLTPGSYPGL